MLSAFEPNLSSLAFNKWHCAIELSAMQSCLTFCILLLVLFLSFALSVVLPLCHTHYEAANSSIAGLRRNVCRDPEGKVSDGGFGQGDFSFTLG